MNRGKSLFFYAFFLVCFYLALIFKFYYFTDLEDQSAKAYCIVAITTLLSGIFLSLCIQAFIQDKGYNWAFSTGIGIAFLFFMGVTLTESVLSEKYFESHDRPEDFSTLTGHCGISVGRPILRYLNEQLVPPEGTIAEFGIDQRCRLRHLDFVMKSDPSFCNPSEDRIDCLTRWMAPIAEHGYWNRGTRKFFFDAVMKTWPQSKKDEALVEYALKDLELESGRQSILKQMGMDDNFSERYLLVQQKEELDHLLLTKEIFEQVGLVISENKITPTPPYVFKFKDTQVEVNSKLDKIPELQKEIDQLGLRPKLSQ